MKKLLLTGIAAIPLLMIQPHRSEAFIVTCANCSDIVTQLWQQAKQAEQYLTQIQQYQTQIQQYANMVQNTVALPQSIWTNVQGDIMQLRSLTNAASLLTGNSGSIMSRLQSAQGYANQASFLPQNIGSQFTSWQQTLGQAGNSLGRTLGLQQQQMNSDAVMQRAIQAQSQSATGQMQVLQASVEMAGITNYNLQQVQSTLANAAQAQATRDLVVADRQASEDAAMQRLLHSQPVVTTGYKGY